MISDLQVVPKLYGDGSTKSSPPEPWGEFMFRETFRMKRQLCVSTAILLLTFGFSACGGAGSSSVLKTPSVTGVAVTSAASSVNVGSSVQLTAMASYSDGSSNDVTSQATWSSSNTSDATVSAAGVVTGVAAGTPTITATFSGKSGGMMVTVTTTATISGLTVTAPSGSGGSVNVGSTLQLTATANYSDGSSQNVTNQAGWSSSNTNSATVSSSGVVTGVASGSPIITASFSGKSGQITISVGSSASVTNLSVTAPYSSTPMGLFLPLTAIATYSNSSTQDVTNQTTWSSSDPTLATINTLGVVHGTAVAPNLTMTGSFGGQTASVSVSIVKNPPPSLLVITPGDAWSYLNSTVQMTATYTPSGGSPQDVTSQTTWTSTNTAKATIDPTGLAHGLMSDGEVIITGTYLGNTNSTLLTVSHAPLPDNTPIMDMTPGQTYMGFSGNLYENNSNLAPADHDSDGIALGGQIQPLDINGNPNPNGAIAFISLGLSNTSLEFKGFVQYVKDPTRISEVNPRLAVLNGAKPSEAACSYVDPVLAPIDLCTIPPYTSTDTQNQYDRVRDEVLATATTAPGVAAGCGTTTNPCLSEKQVQAIWLKEASPAPEESGFSTLCNPSTAGCANTPTTTEAVHFEQQIGQIVRAAQARYPNLKQVFLASRIYAGYIIIDKSPEVFAYEYGFSAKWAIQAQINQIRGMGVDPVAGNLNYNDGTAPWIAWGPYLWADGMNPRSDGLVWIKDTDYQTKDYQHPSDAGIAKVDGLLFTFFTSSVYTPWFRP